MRRDEMPRPTPTLQIETHSLDLGMSKKANGLFVRCAPKVGFGQVERIVKPENGVQVLGQGLQIRLGFLQGHRRTARVGAGRSKGGSRCGEGKGNGGSRLHSGGGGGGGGGCLGVWVLELFARLKLDACEDPWWVKDCQSIRDSKACPSVLAFRSSTSAANTKHHQPIWTCSATQHLLQLAATVAACSCVKTHPAER